MATVDSILDPAQSRTTNPDRPGVCRVTLQINGTAYCARPCKDNAPFASVKAFWLRKAIGGRTYVVAQTLAGYECNCPAFTYWPGPLGHPDRAAVRPGWTDSPKTCKHVRALVAAGLLESETRLARPRLAAPHDATLAEHADHEANAYRATGTAVGELFARTMDELALKIRMTHATTPDEYEARIEVLDDGIRAEWEARGYEQGLRGGCRCGEHFPD